MGIERFGALFAEILECDDAINGRPYRGPNFYAGESDKIIAKSLARGDRIGSLFAEPGPVWHETHLPRGMTPGEMTALRKSIVDGGKRHSTDMQAITKALHSMTKFANAFAAKARAEAAARDREQLKTRLQAQLAALNARATDLAGSGGFNGQQ